MSDALDNTKLEPLTNEEILAVREMVLIEKTARRLVDLAHDLVPMTVEKRVMLEYLYCVKMREYLLEAEDAGFNYDERTDLAVFFMETDKVIRSPYGIILGNRLSEHIEKHEIV